MKLCHLGQDSESEIWERFIFCLKNAKYACWIFLQYQILNLDPNDKVSSHNGRCLKFNGYMVILAPKIRGFILVDRQSLSWKIAYNHDISDFACFKSRSPWQTLANFLQILCPGSVSTQFLSAKIYATRQAVFWAKIMTPQVRSIRTICCRPYMISTL